MVLNVIQLMAHAFALKVSLVSDVTKESVMMSIMVLPVIKSVSVLGTIQKCAIRPLVSVNVWLVGLEITAFGHAHLSLMEKLAKIHATV